MTEEPSHPRHRARGTAGAAAPVFPGAIEGDGAGGGERDHARRMVVHDRVHVRLRLADRAVDEALEIRLAPAPVDRLALERELHEVLALDAVGRARPRQEEAVRPLRMARADVTE